MNITRISGSVSKLNAFGHEIPSLAECINSKKLHSLLLRQLASILPQQNDRAHHLAQLLFDSATGNLSDENAASATQELLQDAGALQHLRRGLTARTARILTQIQPYVIGRTVLDYGCGDGEVGRRLRDLGYSASLCDVMDYRTEGARTLPWRLLSDKDENVTSATDVDSLLLLTVLHHCQSPERTLHQVKTILPRRIITIESVYDVNESEVLDGMFIETCTTADALDWLHLAIEEQFRYACFWDWFYNKVVNSNVIVPYNFSSPNKWKDRLAATGYDEVKRVYLGMDQPLVPEFHVLQVFDLPE